MVAARINRFGGMIPSQDDRLLPDTAATYSEAAFLYNGALRPMPQPTLVRALDDPNATTVFRIPNNFTDFEHIADATWMEFSDIDTNVIRAPVSDDSFDRYYWVAPSLPPTYNTATRILAGNTGGNAPYLLGVPAPTVAPGLGVTGGSGTTVTRAYVYTWVTTFGEESAPSPAETVTGFENGSWDLTLTAPDADDVGGPDRDIATVRIYRTVTSATGTATFFFVAEQVISDTTYSDTASDQDVTANDQLASTNWTPPPEDLEGWVTMPNGMLAGWRGTELWFCEPYRPHAWPGIFTLTVDYPIIGLGVTAQTLVVCTTGFPVTVTGIRPDQMSMSKIATWEPCMSRGSIISTPEGVYYASPNGLVLVANGSANVVTRQLIYKAEWQASSKIGTLRAARLNLAYFAYGTARQGVFDTDTFETTAFAQEDFTGALNGVLLDATDLSVAFNVLQSQTPMINVMNDPWTGEVLFIRDGNVYWLNVAEVDWLCDTALWRSKIFQTPEKTNFGAMEVFFETTATTPSLNPVRNTNLVQTLAADQWGLVRIYADGRLCHTQELRDSQGDELVRPPSGFKASFWQIEFETRVKILSVQMANTMKELGRV